MNAQDAAIHINEIAMHGVPLRQQEAYRAAIEYEIARLSAQDHARQSRPVTLDARHRRVLGDEGQRMAARIARAIYTEIAARQ